MPFVKGQSGNPAGRASEKLFTDAVRKAALLDDPVRKIRRLDIIAEKLVKKAMAGEDWAIGQVGDRLDGKPKERVEQGGMVDHAIPHNLAGHAGDQRRGERASNRKYRAGCSPSSTAT